MNRVRERESGGCEGTELRAAEWGQEMLGGRGLLKRPPKSSVTSDGQVKTPNFHQPVCVLSKSWSMSGKRVAENLTTFSLSSGIALLLGLIYKPYTWEFLFMLK